MNLIRYQAPELSNWPTLDRWSNLRDELNSLFDLPSTSIAVTRHRESEGSSYYRHFYHGLLTADGRPKLALQALVIIS